MNRNLAIQNRLSLADRELARSALAVGALALSVALSGCGGLKKEEAQSVPAEKAGAIGPFDLALSSADSPVENAFSARINQAEGAVDFYLPTSGDPVYLAIESADAKAAGCDASKVRVEYRWRAAEGDASARLANVGDVLKSAGGRRARLTVGFRNLGGCTNLEFKMRARKIHSGGLPSDGDSRLFDGTWMGRHPSGHETLWIMSPHHWGWEGSGTFGVVCDASFWPSSSSSPTGGVIASENLNLICEYRFVDEARSKMRVDCFGEAPFRCELPRGLVMTKS